MKKLIVLTAFLVGFLLSAQQTEAACYSKYVSTPGLPASCGFLADECPAGTKNAGLCCDKPADCGLDSAPAMFTTGSIAPPPASTPAAAGSTATSKKICDFVPAAKRGDCSKCFDKNPPEVYTAIGCIPTTPQGLFSKFFMLGIGMAGGIAFLLILFGGFQVLTSAGNPEQLNAGRELIGAAITGLLLIIFSIFILRLIGYNILGLPGFG